MGMGDNPMLLKDDKGCMYFVESNPSESDSVYSHGLLSEEESGLSASKRLLKNENH
jgi:hypothetical protein